MKKTTIGDVAVVIGTTDNPYTATQAVGDERVRALEALCYGDDTSRYTFWHAPVSGGARVIERNDIDWRGMRTTRRWVDFDDGTMIVRGFEGAKYPVTIDKAAELVLTSTEWPVAGMTIIFDGDTPSATWAVVATSETHVGGTGRTTRIDGQ